MWLKKFVTFSIVKWRSKKLGNRETKSKNSSSKLSVQANHRHGLKGCRRCRRRRKHKMK